MRNAERVSLARQEDTRALLGLPLWPRVTGETFQFLGGASLQNDPGIARQLPQLGVEPTPDIIGQMIPRPSEIERYFYKLVEACKRS